MPRSRAIPLCFFMLTINLFAEAFAAKQTDFFGVPIVPRGGVQSSAPPPVEESETLSCVMQQPPTRNGMPSSSNGSNNNNNNGFNNNDNNKNGSSFNGAAINADGFELQSAALLTYKPSYQRTPVEYVSEAKLPTDLGNFMMRAYKLRNPPQSPLQQQLEPIVIYSPKHGLKSTSCDVRLHDQCFTSEVFRSQRCDCREQLEMCLRHINEFGGCVIYLQQEGRGIGLANKVAAYALQDVGLDTVDANLHLGFPEDMREYGVVPGILEDLGIESIQLLTNNPRKTQILQNLGIDVVSTSPMVVPTSTPHNQKYLETKYMRMDHANLANLVNNNNNNGSMAPRRKNGVAVPKQEPDVAPGAKAREDGYCFGRESVEAAISAIRDGKMVVVVDDESRENEGDLIMAADAVTGLDMAKIVRYSSGVICVAMPDERMRELDLPPMVSHNEDPKGTAFTVSVDATSAHGITTGISADERALTCRLLADPSMTAKDFNRPGHLFPLRSKPRGVLERDGHTEAAVDLSRLAGRGSAGILCEIVSEEHPTKMMKLAELEKFAQTHGLVLTSIVDLVQYRKETGL